MRLPTQPADLGQKDGKGDKQDDLAHHDQNAGFRRFPQGLHQGNDHQNETQHDIDMGYSKPSISHAVGVLRDGGFLTVDPGGFLLLTDIGREVAEKIYERHQFFTQWLIGAGIDPETAEQDAWSINTASR